MDEIVWAVNPKYDTLDSLAAYVGRFAQQYLSAAGIRCRLRMPVQLPSLALRAEVRHNIFLAFKEALNNIVKHSRATEVSITLNHDPHHFVLLLVDNGQGMQASHPERAAPSVDALRSSSGNGLLNMQKRMEEIGGRCGWDSTPGKGTRVTLNAPINR
jgi:signal transduction histidine kinase